jgi:hypothetical protein
VIVDRIFTDENQKALIEALEKVENEETGKGINEKCHALVHELSKSVKK